MTQLSFYPPSLTKPYELSLSALKSVLEPEGVSYSKRVPNCQKCGQHGRKSRLKGHKRVCPYRDCPCAKCQVVSERQKLMADQIKIRRRQRKDTLMNMTRENITATLNAAAAVAAAGQAANFGGLNGLNALLCNQLKAPQTLLPPATSQHPTAVDFSTLPLLSSPPDLLKSSLLFPSPVSLLTPSPSNPATPSTPPASLVAPVPINPSTFSFPLLTSTNEQLFQSLLSNFKILSSVKEELPSVVVSSASSVLPSTSSATDQSAGLIDVCSV